MKQLKIYLPVFALTLVLTLSFLWRFSELQRDDFYLNSGSAFIHDFIIPVIESEDYRHYIPFLHADASENLEGRLEGAFRIITRWGQHQGSVIRSRDIEPRRFFGFSDPVRIHYGLDSAFELDRSDVRVSLQWVDEPADWRIVDFEISVPLR